MSDVVDEEIEWVVAGKIASRTLTLVDGDAGTGKTNFVLDLIARVSAGRPAPDGTAIVRGGAILLAPEDPIGAVVKKRLVAMDADLENIAFNPYVDGSVCRIPDDIDQLRELAVKMNCRVMVIDPLMAHMPTSKNTWSDADTRDILNPLIALADELNFAVIGVRHPTKKTESSALHAGAGSVAFAATARAVFLIGKDPRDNDLRIIAPVKFNLGVMPLSESFEIVQASNGASRIEWRGSSEIDAESLRRQAIPTKNIHESKLNRAMSLAMDFLSDGPQPSARLAAQVAQHGISAKTLERASARLGIIKTKKGAGSEGVWISSLPKEKMTTYEEGEAA
jgi:hypothetical protein